MNTSVILAIIVGLIAVLYLSSVREGFVPEFLDQGNVKRTAETSSSSYAQETNHFKPTIPPAEPIPGIETPFRVNAYNSYQPL